MGVRNGNGDGKWGWEMEWEWKGTKYQDMTV